MFGVCLDKIRETKVESQNFSMYCVSAIDIYTEIEITEANTVLPLWLPSHVFTTLVPDLWHCSGLRLEPWLFSVVFFWLFTIWQPAIQFQKRYQGLHLWGTEEGKNHPSPLELELQVFQVLVPSSSIQSSSQNFPGNWHLALGSIELNIPLYPWTCLCRVQFPCWQGTPHEWHVSSGRDGQAEANKSYSAGCPFHISRQRLQTQSRKEDFDSEARITKCCKYCPRAQSSCLRLSRVFLNPLFGLSCINSSTYNIMAVLLKAIVKCCETCLRKICKSQVHSFIACIITRLVKYKLPFLCKSSHREAGRFFSTLCSMKVEANYHRSLLLQASTSDFGIWPVGDGRSQRPISSVSPSAYSTPGAPVIFQDPSW